MSLHNDGPELSRRAFLKTAAIAGAGLAATVAGCNTRQPDGPPVAAAETKPAVPAAEPELERRNESPDLVYHRFGRTNLATSALAFGGQDLAPDKMPAFEAAIDAGINLAMLHFDVCAKTAAPWLAKSSNRNRLFVGATANPKEIDRMLKELGIDCVDLLMPGFNTADHAAGDTFFRQFEDLKKAGKARFLCLVNHANGPEVVKAAVKTDYYDAMCLCYSHSTRDGLRPFIADARKKDIGLSTMKSLAGLPKDQSFLAAWQTFAADGVPVIFRTINTKADLSEFIKYARKDVKPALSKAEGVAAVDCSGLCSLCGACAACPKGVAIQDALRNWQYYGQQWGRVEMARAKYAQIPLQARADACANCGRCEAVCPRNLDVRRLVREAHEALA